MADKQGKILATFKIQPEKWEAFKAKTGNASALLNQLIDEYLDKHLDDAVLQPETESELAIVADNLCARFEALEGKINEVMDKAVSSLPNMQAIRDRVIRDWPKQEARIRITQFRQ